MIPIVFRVAAVMVSAACLATAQPGPVPAGQVAAFDLAETVRILASDDYAGRAEPDIERTRVFIEAAFKRAGLRPLGANYRSRFAHPRGHGFNLVGRLVSTHAAKLPGHVIVSAHYDHLGRRGGRIYNGACDNASGVAALLQLAFSLQPDKIRRDVLFIAFDQEERGLLGSYAYAERPLLPLKDCRFFITMDMLGRKALGLIDDLVFVQGWEWTPSVLKILEKRPRALKLETSCFWTDVGGDRSDFVAFKKKRVPHLYFSVGQNEDYHQPTDDFEKIDTALLKRQADLVAHVARELAGGEKPLTYRQVPDLNLVEFTSLKRLAGALTRSDHVRVTADLRKQAMFLVDFADRVIRRGRVTSKDRVSLLRVFKTLRNSTP